MSAARAATSLPSAVNTAPAVRALDERAAELGLQFAYLHGERRLRDAGGLCRPAEVAGAGEGLEVAKLTKTDHSDQYI